MIKLEQFKKDMSWSMLSFTEEQLQQILNAVEQDEFASVEEFADEYGDETMYFVDKNLSAIIENFSDLGEDEIIENIVSPFSDIYLFYLEEDEVYLAVIEQ